MFVAPFESVCGTKFSMFSTWALDQEWSSHESPTCPVDIVLTEFAKQHIAWCINVVALLYTLPASRRPNRQQNFCHKRSIPSCSVISVHNFIIMQIIGALYMKSKQGSVSRFLEGIYKQGILSSNLQDITKSHAWLNCVVGKNSQVSKKKTLLTSDSCWCD